MTKAIQCLVMGLLCIVVIPIKSNSQLPENLGSGRIANFTEEFIRSTNTNRQKLLIQLGKRLREIQGVEMNLTKKMDSSSLIRARELQADLQRKIDEVESLIEDPDSLFLHFPSGPYVPRIDSLSSMFAFLKSQASGLSFPFEQEKLLAQQRQLLLYSENLETWLGNRKFLLGGLFSSGNKIIPGDIRKYFNEWLDKAQGCRQQIEYWKDNLRDSRKMEQEVLSLLRKLPAFNDFMSRNGELARLFGSNSGSSSGGPGSPVPGLQSIESMMQDLQQRFGTGITQNGGPLQQQLQDGMDQIAQTQSIRIPGMVLSEGFSSTGGNLADVGSRQEERASFNSLTFRQRLELGWNLQSATRLQSFPSVRDVGLSLGYKLNPRSVIGAGIAYKFALGENWKDIEWTHEGFGIRTFVDWRFTQAGSKIFKGIWLTGGFEMNYWSRIAGNVQWNQLAWRKAGLAGLTKTIIGKKHNGKLQILFNYLETNLPLQDRLSIRWGKTF